MNMIDRIVQALLRHVRHDMKPKEVEAALTKLAAGKSEALDWRNSITDLLKLLDLDSSANARKKLALEFGYKGPIDGSAKMNMWLHDQVMREVASRGIKLPK